jgi:hypothetical protein
MVTAPEQASEELPIRRIPLRCAECGYELGSYRVLPPCPNCRELCWEPAPWRPFTRRRDVSPEMEARIHGEAATKRASS